MPLHEDLIFADPVLQRVFFDDRRFAIRRNANFGRARFDMGLLQLAFLKAASIEAAEAHQRRIRAAWFSLRAQSDGYFLELPSGHDDGCEHVVAFAHGCRDPAFQINRRARAAVWYKYAQRPPPPWL